VANLWRGKQLRESESEISFPSPSTSGVTDFGLRTAKLDSYTFRILKMSSKPATKPSKAAPPAKDWAAKRAERG